MTDEELEAIRRRAVLATPPTDGTRWIVEPSSSWEVYSGPLSADSCDIASNIFYEADAVFIAHARRDIPALLQEVEKLNKLLEDYKLIAWLRLLRIEELKADLEQLTRLQTDYDV